LTVSASVGVGHLGNEPDRFLPLVNQKAGAASNGTYENAALVTGGYTIPVSYGSLTAWASLGGEGTVGNTYAGNSETLGSFQARETARPAPVGVVTPGAGWRLPATDHGAFPRPGAGPMAAPNRMRISLCRLNIFDRTQGGRTSDRLDLGFLKILGSA
jgi:hypothetical protein